MHVDCRVSVKFYQSPDRRAMLQGQAALLRAPLLTPAVARSGRLCWHPSLSRHTCDQRSGHQKASRVMASSPVAGSATAAGAAAEPPGTATSSALWQAITERYDTAQRDAAATMTDTNTGRARQARRAGCLLPCGATRR